MFKNEGETFYLILHEHKQYSRSKLGVQKSQEYKNK